MAALDEVSNRKRDEEIYIYKHLQVQNSANPYPLCIVGHSEKHIEVGLLTPPIDYSYHDRLCALLSTEFLRPIQADQ